MNSDNEDYQTRLARIERLVESNAKAIAANSAGITENRQSINTLAEAAGRTLAGIERLRDIVDDNRADFEDYRTRNDATIASLNANIASINAAVERLEAIATQLVRERGNNS